MYKKSENIIAHIIVKNIMEMLQSQWLQVLAERQRNNETVAGEETYEFAGVHFIASYIGCQPDRISSPDALRIAMDNAVQASGATILNKVDHVFGPEGGYTSIYLLSESHATIHTYPEVRSCFVDLFTCGTKCSYDAFNKKLEEFLNPLYVNLQVIKRDSENETLSKASVKRHKS